MKRVAVMVLAGVLAGVAIGEKFDVRNVPHKRIELWPEGGMPQVATNLDNQAWIEVFLPTQRVHKAFMIIAPGGAYNWWCWAGEGSRMLEHCLKNGMPAAQLKYRCPRPKGAWFALNAWQDAQRAVRVVRSRAAEFGIDPENIGFNGYSAGGHLTLLAALSSSSNSYARVDATDDVPCHVNWAIPVYPAYVLSDCQGDWSGGSKKGNPLDLELRPEFKFDAKTPPLCFFHGDADEYSAMGSVRVYHRLRTMGIPAELHIFANKGHVFFADASDGESCKNFRDVAFGWLNSMGYTLETPRKVFDGGRIGESRKGVQEALWSGVRGFRVKVGAGDGDKAIREGLNVLRRRPEIVLEVEVDGGGFADGAARAEFLRMLKREAGRAGVSEGVMTVMSGDMEVLKAAKGCRMGFGLLAGGAGGVEEALALGAVRVCVPIGAATAELVERVHARGAKLTVSGAEYGKAKAAGADAVVGW